MKTISFPDLELSKELEKAIIDLGFEEPTPIQALAIPMMKEGHDVIGQAHTGSGKTAAYGVPLLGKIDQKDRRVQALVMCPTRELAIQVSEELAKLAQVPPGYYDHPGLRRPANRTATRRPEKGCAGRYRHAGQDHSTTCTAVPSTSRNVKVVVLDEADEMLDMGFRDDIGDILEQDTCNTPDSAFLGNDGPRPSWNWQRNTSGTRRLVKVVHEQLTVPTIEQFYYEMRESDKIEAFCRLIDRYNPKLSLVFCNTKRRVDEVTSRLIARGYSAEGLHGDMTQGQRERVMAKYRSRCDRTSLLRPTSPPAGLISRISKRYSISMSPRTPNITSTASGGLHVQGGQDARLLSFPAKEIWKLRDIQRYAKVRISPTSSRATRTSKRSADCSRPSIK